MRRMFWMTFGFGLGVYLVTWAIKRVESTLDKLLPGKISSTLDGMMKRWLSGLQEALDEGRRVMRERETELHAQLQRGQVITRSKIKVR